jgi:hypothetical protein
MGGIQSNQAMWGSTLLEKEERDVTLVGLILWGTPAGKYLSIMASLCY